MEQPSKYDQSLTRILQAASNNWITTRELDRILLEVWGNDYDAKMCCNSMMLNGYIDYYCDGDWQLFYEEQQ